jgi:hypothetical protein
LSQAVKVGDAAGKAFEHALVKADKSLPKPSAFRQNLRQLACHA